MSEAQTFSTATGCDTILPTGNAEGMLGTMGNWFSFGEGDSLSEIALEVPDDAEEVDLKRHATRCALRYRSLRQAQKDTGVRLRRIEIFLLVGIVALLATSEGAHTVLRGFLGF